VTSAQIDAWVGVHKGAIDTVARDIDQSLADAALARMMLHRRRAVVARVANDFLARVGSRFRPYLDSRAAHAPTDMAMELATAKIASDLVSNFVGASVALQFERAMLAEMDGRTADAVADLDQVLDAYPGFLVAAEAAARQALAAGDPARAIRFLACVERELKVTREGSALLADALHSVGLHDAASRYDLSALTSTGDNDSRGNDFAPTDVTGKAVTDDRISAVLYVESRRDGRMLLNDRGLYYLANPGASGLLSELRDSGHSLANIRRRGVRTAYSMATALRESLEALSARLQLFLSMRLPAGVKRASLRVIVGVRGASSRAKVNGRRSIGEYYFRLLTRTYRLYKRLPRSVRHYTNRLLRPVINLIFGKGIYQIPRGDRRSPIVKARTQAGLVRIFQAQTQFASDQQDVERTLPDFGIADTEKVLALDAARIVLPTDIPPPAKKALNELIREADFDQNVLSRS
jgi:hypothetical protein